MSNKRGTRAKYANNLSRVKNSAMETYYIRKLTELMLARFTWKNVPDTIDVRFIEKTLFYQGLVIFYWDNDYSRYLALRGMAQGVINMYDNPTKFTTLGNSMTNKTLLSSECVPIWGNRMRTPESDGVMLFAHRLGEVDKTVDINITTLRHPIMLVTDQNEKLSIFNAWREIEEGHPVIATLPSLGDNLQSKIFAVDLTGSNNSSDQITKLQVAKQSIFNDFMTMIGVNNATTTKQERLVASEVGANDSQVLSFRNAELDTRNYACEQINSMFGLDMSVEWSADIDAMADATKVGIGAGVSDDSEASDFGGM